MKSLKQYISEALDQPYPWRWEKDFSYRDDAIFTTSSGREVTVYFSHGGTHQNHKVYELVFRDDKGFGGVRNEKDQFRTLATVQGIVIEWMRKNPDAIIRWVGEGQRGKVYIKMIRTILKNYPSFRREVNVWQIVGPKHTIAFMMSSKIDPSIMSSIDKAERIN